MEKSFLKNINILYVEDEKEIRQLTCSFLERFVNNIIIAENGEQGLELFDKHYYDNDLENIDLVLLDINMPKMNGLDMLDKISKIDQSILSIITTAHNDATLLKQAINCGVRSYINKPLNMHELIDSLASVYESKYLTDNLYKKNKQLELKIEQTTFELRSILDAQDNLILVLSNDILLDVNQTLLDFFGFSTLKEFSAKYESIGQLFISKNNYFTRRVGEIWTDEIMKLEDNNRVVVMRNKYEEEKIFRVNVKSFMFDTKHSVVSFTDITELKHYTYELQYKATHDNLTKLYNRQKFDDELDKEIIRENRYKHGLSLMMLDIDNFKSINDEYGHDIGDVVLKDVSRVLLDSKRATDFAYRWGGEEFTVLLPETTLDESYQIADKIRINIENHKSSVLPHNITVSIGTAQFQSNKDDFDSFIKNVDTAMYKAKKTGKNKVIKYEK